MKAICRCSDCESERAFRQAKRALFQQAVAALREHAFARRWASAPGARAGADDPHVVAAHRFLCEHNVDPTLIPSLDAIVVEPLAEETYGCCYLARCNDEFIIAISPTSPFYANAANDVVPLAGLLVHEQAHVVHGAAEARAYQEHYMFLKTHGAEVSLLNYVERMAVENDVPREVVLGVD